MNPIIPNSKEPWKVDPEQLKLLDETILSCFPNAKLSEGVKYARWAQVDSQIPNSVFDSSFGPDHVFMGMLMGKPVKILMWLPFFN